MFRSHLLTCFLYLRMFNVCSAQRRRMIRRHPSHFGNSKTFIYCYIVCSLFGMLSGRISNKTGFRMDQGLSGVQYDFGRLGTFQSESLSICSVYCIRHQCKSFSFSKTEQVCLLYNQVFCNASQGNEFNGTRFYTKILMQGTTGKLPKDCREVPSKGMFVIQPQPGRTLLVWCEYDGWTVFQRRLDGSVDFFRDWDSYMRGFGDRDREHWLGNENLHLLTSDGQTELRVELQSFDGTVKFAQYSRFYVYGSVNNYRLRVHGLSNCSTAGDALDKSNGHEFFTIDKDSRYDCAYQLHGAWWMNKCCTCNSNLNGRYTDDRNKRDKSNVFWVTFGDRFLPLKSTKMMLRKLN